MRKNICSKCGNVLDEFDKVQNFTIDKLITYGSIYDGERIKIQLCCECMDEFINGCRFLAEEVKS